MTQVLFQSLQLSLLYNWHILFQLKSVWFKNQPEGSQVAILLSLNVMQVMIFLSHPVIRTSNFLIASDNGFCFYRLCCISLKTCQKMIVMKLLYYFFYTNQISIFIDRYPCNVIDPSLKILNKIQKFSGISSLESELLNIVCHNSLFG